MPPALSDQWKRVPALLELRLDGAQPGTGGRRRDGVVRPRGGRGEATLLLPDRDLFRRWASAVAVIELRRDGQPLESDQTGCASATAWIPCSADFIALRSSVKPTAGRSGVGAKTAAELLRRYGSLEAVLEAAGQPASVIRDEMRPRGGGAAGAVQLRAFGDIRGARADQFAPAGPRERLQARRDLRAQAGNEAPRRAPGGDGKA
jgi:hypothetical protein